MKVKHVSFDAWNTLITANPTYAAWRSAFLGRACGVSDEEAHGAYKQIKLMADHDAAYYGHQYSHRDLVFHLITKMRGTWSDYLYEGVSNRMDDAFMLFPPTMTNETITVLEQILDKGVGISVTSNTNFTRGEVLDRVLFGTEAMQRRTHRLFDFAVYSDREGIAKPSKKIFDIVVGRSGQKREEILHVGDHQRCDGWGSTQAGLQSLMVEGPHDLHKVLEMI